MSDSKRVRETTPDDRARRVKARTDKRPSGFTLIRNAVGKEMEECVKVYNENVDGTFQWRQSAKGRRMLAIGKSYTDFPRSVGSSGTSEEVDHIAACIPVELPTLPRSNSALINVYEPGAGIGYHRDAHMDDDDSYVLCVSLGSDCWLDFRHVETRKRWSVHVPTNSIYIMRGEILTEWEHGIARRKTDPSPTSSGARVTRRQRTSITLRHVK